MTLEQQRMSHRAKARMTAWLAICLVLLLLAGCGQTGTEMQDGYYTAEMAAFDDYGWKEFLTIYVRDTKIVTVEYNAKNASGLIKSWDMDYMREMDAVDGTYPNEYTRIYADALLSRQDPERVDAVAGATHSHHTFQQLAQAVIARAKAGDNSIAYVEAE